MDMTSHNSVELEKQAFLTKCRKNPIFLIRHIKSLSGVAWQRLRQNHLNKIIKPLWLQDINALDEDNHQEIQEIFSRIPQRQWPTHGFMQQRPTGHQIKTAEDSEDYFVEHRFTQLYQDQVLSPLVRNWLKNPPKKTDSAWETYSTCERVANLLTWISFLPPEKRVIPEAEQIKSLLADSLRWIFDHLEYYGKRTSNHILNNARALVMAGVVLGNQRAINVGMQIFKNMLPVLVQPNGFLRERSSHYQLLVLTWLLDAYTFLQFAKVDFLKETILKMRDAAAMLCDESGYLQAFIGDISPDMTPHMTCQRLAACYPDSWPTKSSHLSRDDWHILINQKNKVIMNWPKGNYPRSHPAHAHNDITSFIWLYENTPILVDAGRLRYTKEPIAIMQKSALGHNVPLVNQFAPVCESLVNNGHWYPAPYAKAELQLRRLGNHTLSISHDGFKRTTPVHSHNRQITLTDSGIHVADTFSGKGEVTIQLIWQMDPSFTRFNTETGTLSNDELEVTMNIPPQFRKGWCTTEYGKAQSNLMLITKWKVNLPFTSTIKFEVKKCVV